MKKTLFSVFCVCSLAHLNAQSTAGVIVRFDNDRDTIIDGTAARVFDVLAKGDANYVTNSSYPTLNGDNNNPDGSFQNLGIVFTHSLNGVNNLSVTDFTIYVNTVYGISADNGHPNLFSNAVYGQAAKFEVTRATPYQADLSTSDYTKIASISYPLSGIGTQIALVDNSQAVSPGAYASAVGGPTSFWSNSSSSNSNYYMKITGENVIALPITYQYFTAVPKGNDALLGWATATETNNAYFDIQRSFDGKAFTKIGQVKGQGTTTAETKYTYTDIKPGTGVVYYRLNQVDIDGHSHLSDIQRVQFATDANVLPTKVYPNPSATGRVNVDFGSQVKSVTVFDITGRKVKELKTSGQVKLPVGSYMFKSFDGEKYTAWSKVVVID